MDEAGAAVAVELTLPVDDEIGFSSLRWRDRVSEPFVGELDLTSRRADLDLTKFLGKRVGVTVRGRSRRVQYLWGTVDRADYRGSRRGWSEYRLRLGPFASARVQRYRTFRESSAIDVVDQVLDEHGAGPAISRVDKHVAVRELIVQHDETDVDFITRLLGEESIGWLFAHDKQGYRFVATDSEPARSRRLPMIRTPADGDGVLSWVTSASVGNDGVRSEASGRAATVGVEVGEVVHLTGHDREDQNQMHVVTGTDLQVVAHPDAMPTDVSTAAEMLADLVAVPSGTVMVTYVPSRPPTGNAYTATVVGPAGEDLYVDDLGRVQVAIDWPDGADDHGAWVPVAQPWAGAGHGTTFWPRVGDRVLVEFIDGDPDRPVVSGSLYTESAKPPAPLPDAKRRTLLTGAAGTIMLDGSGSHERIVIDANRDCELLAANDLTITADGDGMVEAGSDLTVESGSDLTLRSGDASIRLTSVGDIDVAGRNVTITAEKKIRLVAPDVTGT